MSRHKRVTARINVIYTWTGGKYLTQHPDDGSAGPPGTGTGDHVVVVVVAAGAAGQEVQPEVAPRQRQDETDGRDGDGGGGGQLVGRRGGRRPAAVQPAAGQEGTVPAPLSHLQQGLQGQVLGERAHTHPHG